MCQSNCATDRKIPGLNTLADSAVGVVILMCHGRSERQHTLTHTKAIHNTNKQRLTWFKNYDVKDYPYGWNCIEIVCGLWIFFSIGLHELTWMKYNRLCVKIKKIKNNNNNNTFEQSIYQPSKTKSCFRVNGRLNYLGKISWYSGKLFF